MAKAREKQEEVEVQVVETTEAPEVSTDAQPAPEAAAPAQPAAAARVSTSVKMIKVHALEEVNCIVSGKRYTIAKGKEVQVPMDVAFILCNAQKVYRV